MGHHHGHQHANTTSDLRIAFFLNLTFTVLEIVGGLLINSVAILSDALHDLGDSLSLGLAWGLQNYSEKEGDQRYTYGYRRYSLLAAFINSVVLIGGSLLILSHAVTRLSDPESFHAPGMVVLAIGGIAVNGFAAYRLRRNSGSNAEVIGWHLMEDVLAWAAVLVVGIISLFADLPILDPILSILITLYILVNVIGNLRKSAQLFLQAVPTDVDLDAIQSQLEAVKGVKSLHHTHIWSLDGEHNVFSAHVVVADDTTPDEIRRIKQAARKSLADGEFEHSTIEIELESEDCSLRPQTEQPATHHH